MDNNIKLSEVAKEFSFAKDCILVNAVSVSENKIRLHLFSFERNEYHILIKKEEGEWRSFYRLPSSQKHALSIEDAALATALVSLTEFLE